MNKIPSAKECAEFGVKDQLTKFIDIIGVGFHPDTYFSDYVDFAKNKPLFTPNECRNMDNQMNECFAMCEKYGLDIYSIALSIMSAKFPLENIIL